jgi:hypothetical protein
MQVTGVIDEAGEIRILVIDALDESVAGLGELSGKEKRAFRHDFLQTFTPSLADHLSTGKH